MRKQIYSTLLALLSIVVPAQAATKSAFADAAASKPKAQLTAKATQRAHGGATLDLLQATQATEASTASSKSKSKVARAVTASDIAATNIQINYGKGDVFATSNVATISLTDDTLTIANFAGYGQTIKAKVDLNSGEFTIAPQTVYISSNYGNCEIVYLNPSFSSFDTTKVVTGRINGSELSIDRWCMRITSGTYKNYIIGSAFASSTFKASNATMTSSVIDTTGNITKVESPVFAEQNNTNAVDVYNFAGQSCVVSVELKGDKTMAIQPQFLFSISGNGYFYCYPYDTETGVYYLRQPILGTTTGNKLEWKGWTIATSNGKYYYRHYADASLQLPFDLTYPTAQTQDGFKGSGTEADPYLIETPADLIALSDSVNYRATVKDSAKYATAYNGVYFKQTKTINMNKLHFNPIGGSDDLVRFAGIYDGGNFTISNLTVNTGSRGYAALFGSVDTVGVIKNLKMTSPKIYSHDYFYTGAVAGNCQGKLSNISVTSATIVGCIGTGGVAGYAADCYNLTVASSKITGDSQTGGVIGLSRDTCSFLSATNTVVTCISTTATSSVGGVAGFISYDRGGNLSDSYFSGDVVLTANGEFGGCIAGVSVASPFTRCFSSGRIYTTSSGYSSSAAGGIVGAIQSATITDCFFTGSLLVPTARSGAITGYAINLVRTGFQDHNEIANVYASGYTRSNSKGDYTPYLGTYDATYGGSVPVVSNAYYDYQEQFYDVLKTGAKPTSFFTSGKAIDGFADSVWTFTEGRYPLITSIGTNAAAYVASSAIFLTDTTQTAEAITEDFTGTSLNSVKWTVLKNGTFGSDGHGVSVSGANFHLNGSFTADTLRVASGTTGVRYVFIKTAPASQFEGSGTEADPFLLKTKADLITLSLASNENNLSFPGTYFLIANDIDMENDTTFIGIGAGSTTYAFGGVLDGGNHTIKNLRIVKCVRGEDGEPTTTSRYDGFVRTLKTQGVVKNVRIGAGGYIESYSNVGAIVGYNNGGNVINCRNYATVKAHATNASGITSYNAANGNVINCYNAGRVSAGYQYAAGIVNNNRGTVENCQNTGEICTEELNTHYKATSRTTAAGIVHSNFGTIKNVLNTGYIHGNKYIGGILGWYNSTAGAVMVSSALNTGRIEADDATYTGNIVGRLYKAGICENAYYDTQISTWPAAQNSDDTEGTKAVTTAFLTSGDTISGLDTAYWQFEAGKYPMLKTFADEPGAQAGAISVVDFGTGSVRCNQVKADASLAKADGLAWSLVKGKAFAIEPGNLSMDPADELTDTLVATYQGFEHRVALVATPDSVPTPDVTRVASQSDASGVNGVQFTDSLAGCTFYYTIDGTDPTTDSKSVAADEVVYLPKGTLNVKVIAAHHNYYNSAVVSVSVESTAVDENVASKEVASVSYVTPSGIVLSEPASGVNVVITRYTDGTATISKKAFK